MRALGRRAPSRTARRTLDGTDEEAGKVEARVWMHVSGEMAASGLGRETPATLTEPYRRRYPRVLALARELADGMKRLSPRNPALLAPLHPARTPSPAG